MNLEVVAESILVLFFNNKFSFCLCDWGHLYSLSFSFLIHKLRWWHLSLFITCCERYLDDVCNVWLKAWHIDGTCYIISTVFTSLYFVYETSKQRMNSFMIVPLETIFINCYNFFLMNYSYLERKHLNFGNIFF